MDQVPCKRFSLFAFTDVFFGLLLICIQILLQFSSFISTAPSHDFGDASIFYFNEPICFVAGHISRVYLHQKITYIKIYPR